MMRPVTAPEREAVILLASVLDEVTRRRIRDDLECASAEDEVEDKSRVIFHLKGYSRGQYVGQHPYAVEGTVSDADGEKISVVLYADHNNRLFELELIRQAEGDVIAPDWTSLVVI
jgi:hypothetical protein